MIINKEQTIEQLKSKIRQLQFANLCGQTTEQTLVNTREYYETFNLLEFKCAVNDELWADFRDNFCPNLTKDWEKSKKYQSEMGGYLKDNLK